MNAADWTPPATYEQVLRASMTEQMPKPTKPPSVDPFTTALATARQAELDIERRQREASEALKQGELFA